MSAAVASSAAMFDERIDPGRVTSIALAAAMHMALFAVLVFGVRWQNRPPEAVQVELWSEPAPAPVETKPAPLPEPVVAKPEPMIAKPEIALKAPEKIKPVQKPVPKAEPLKPKVDDVRKRMQEVLAREQADREQQQLRDRLAKDASATTAKALASWMGKIQIHIKNRINKDIADAVPGNPASVFVVTLLPNCEVLRITLQKSGGNKAYDDEVERAILRASPLPRPDKAEVFDRELRLTFRPKDKDI